MAKDSPAKGTKRAQKDAEDVAARSTLMPKSIRLDVDLVDGIQQMADAREMSFSSVMRAAGEMYLMREHFAVGLENVEANIGATLNNIRRDISRVAEDQQLLIAYLDQFAKFVMMVLPQVVDKEGALALGNQRHDGFIKDFHKAFSARKKRSKLSMELDRMESEG